MTISLQNISLYHIASVKFRNHHLTTTNNIMAPSRTSTIKSKHAANKSGIRNSKNSGMPQGDGVSKSRKPKSKGPPPKPQKSTGNLVTLKKKRRVYTEKELGIPSLNTITPIGVEKPKGKKKGKVFVDDAVSRTTFDGQFGVHLLMLLFFRRA